MKPIWKAKYQNDIKICSPEDSIKKQLMNMTDQKLSEKSETGCIHIFLKPVVPILLLLSLTKSVNMNEKQEILN